MHSSRRHILREKEEVCVSEGMACQSNMLDHMS